MDEKRNSLIRSRDQVGERASPHPAFSSIFKDFTRRNADDIRGAMNYVLSFDQQEPAAPAKAEIRGPGRQTTKDTKIKNACSECKRRKVRCDGTHPCYHCRWYKIPERCFYPRPQPRPSLSRKSMDYLRTRLDDAKSVLQRLFPSATLEALVPLTRDELIELIHTSPEAGDLSPIVATNRSTASPQSMDMDRQSQPLQSLEEEVADDFEYDEPVNNLEGTDAVADDVNALSLRQDRGSSYLGASSVAAALRVILRIAPVPLLPGPQPTTTGHKSLPSSGRSSRAPSRPQTPIISRPPSPEHQHLINAYFQYVHPITPMVDEEAVRADYASAKRKDSAWLGLLNMILALGTIASHTSDSNEDIRYYNAAKSYLGLDSFGSGHIETVQALGLMAGHYLHYRNRPNMASGIMGAAFRMAYGLGLHREFTFADKSKTANQRETKRRTWWCLVVMDTSASTTLGRPSTVPQFSAAVNVPGNIDDETGKLVGGPTVYSSLIAEIEYSRLAARIQERLINSPLLNFSEMLTCDAHLVHWYDNLPSYLKAPNPCPPLLQQPRATIKWRFQNLRIILYRSVLLDAALRRVSLRELTPDENVCISKCHAIAKEAIESIASEWTENQFSGWPAVWFLFQACIIPILCIYSYRDDTQQLDEWNQQVQKSITLFQEMEPWSVAARKTRELVCLLFEASKVTRDQNLFQVTTDRMVHPHPELTGPMTPVQPQGSCGGGMLWEGFFDFPELDFPELGVGVNGPAYSTDGIDWEQPEHRFEY
ncbi:hypothetical protein BZG36_04478 [Bifiguratus adelaidae]|uniref:Zn(2)-C6 fungal-type domain-containing protein n=1 Tax=Bifiguratus adelaidae TaxID=1938954 RepID=A0A261XVV1_9FUNG|nr:hypothetical protein BZG36_04478 [Bifiguratus adelaidae]